MPWSAPGTAVLDDDFAWEIRCSKSYRGFIVCSRMVSHVGWALLLLSRDVVMYIVHDIVLRAGF